MVMAKDAEVAISTFGFSFDERGFYVSRYKD